MKRKQKDLNTQLQNAASNFVYAKTKALLEDGADPDAKILLKGEDYSHLLHHGIQRNNLAYFNLLLEFKANINVVDSSGYTPFRAAVHYKKLPFIASLCEHGANFNELDGKTQKELCDLAYEEDNPDIALLYFQERINEGQNPKLWVSDTGSNILHYALSKGATKTARMIIERDFVDINAVDGLGRSPLYLAAEAGDLDLVELLLTKGADPTLIAEGKFTALDMAAYKGHLPVVRFLVEQNLFPLNSNHLFLAAHQGQPDVALYAIEHGFGLESISNDNQKNLLKAAVKHGNVALVKHFQEAGFDLFTPLDGEPSFLEMAATNGHSEMMEFLLGIEDMEQYCQNALVAAAEKGHSQMIKPLLAHGAKLNQLTEEELDRFFRDIAARDDREAFEIFRDNTFGIPGYKQHVWTFPNQIETTTAEACLAVDYLDVATLDQQDSNGNTLLHFAASKKYAEKLIAKGVNLRTRNNKGEEPIHFMGVYTGYPEVPEIIQMLLDAGVPVDTEVSKEHQDSEATIDNIKRKIAERSITHSINRAFRFPNTALAQSFARENHACTRVLLKNGASAHGVSAKERASYLRWLMDSDVTDEEILDTRVRTSDYVTRNIAPFRDITQSQTLAGLAYHYYEKAAIYVSNKLLFPKSSNYSPELFTSVELNEYYDVQNLLQEGKLSDNEVDLALRFAVVIENPRIAGLLANYFLANGRELPTDEHGRDALDWAMYLESTETSENRDFLRGIKMLPYHSRYDDVVDTLAEGYAAEEIQHRWLALPQLFPSLSLSGTTYSQEQVLAYEQQSTLPHYTHAANMALLDSTCISTRALPLDGTPFDLSPSPAFPGTLDNPTIALVDFTLRWVQRIRGGRSSEATKATRTPLTDSVETYFGINNPSRKNAGRAV